MQNNPANQYIVRVWTKGEGFGTIEFRPWAFSAQDARVQIETEMTRGYGSCNVIYVGPVNPDCKCSSECVCGRLTAVEAKYRSEITKEKPPPTPMPSRGVP